MTHKLTIHHFAATIVVIAISALASTAQTNDSVGAKPSPSPASSTSMSLENRINKLEEQIAVLKVQKPPKDHWDKLSALSGFISGVLVAAIGAVVTVMFKRRETAMLEAQKSREEQDRKAALELAQTHQETERINKEKEISISQAQTVRELLPDLQATDEKTKKAALTLIAFLGNAELAAQLSSLYETEFSPVLKSIIVMPGAKPEARLEAAVALGRFGSRPEGITALVDLSNDAKFDSAKRLSIAEELERLEQHEKAGEVFLKVALDPKTRPEERHLAIAALKRVKYTENATAKVTAIARNEQEPLKQRLAAIDAWSELDSTEADGAAWTSLLLEMLRGAKNPSDLNAIIENCKSLGCSERAAEVLLEIGSDSNINVAVRYAAVENLIKSGIEKFAQPAEQKRKDILRGLARDPLADPTLRLNALREGLGAESNDENGIILREIIDSPQTSELQRFAAIQMLGKFGFTDEAKQKSKEFILGAWGKLYSKLFSKKSAAAKKEPTEVVKDKSA